VVVSVELDQSVDVLCWLHQTSVQEKGPLRTIIRVYLQGSMKRAYNQQVLLCFQTLFTYGGGKGEASSVFRVLHHMKQAASTGSPA